MDGLTPLREQLDERSFERRDIRRDSAILELELEVDRPKEGEPAQLLVGLEQVEFFSVVVLYPTLLQTGSTSARSGETYCLNCPGIVNLPACSGGQKCRDMMVG